MLTSGGIPREMLHTMKLILDRWGGKLTESGLTLNSDWRDIELNRTGA